MKLQDKEFAPSTQATGVFPFSRRREGTEASLVRFRSPGKISRLGEYPRTRWEFSQRIVGEKKRLNNLVYVGYQ